MLIRHVRSPGAAWGLIAETNGGAGRLQLVTALREVPPFREPA